MSHFITRAELDEVEDSIGLVLRTTYSDLIAMDIFKTALQRGCWAYRWPIPDMEDKSMEERLHYATGVAVTFAKDETARRVNAFEEA